MASQIRTIAGRRVVLKPLDEHCLLDGDLHPSIRLRLSRIRELPMTAVANLHGVERIDGQVFLVWDYVEGWTLEEIDPQARQKLAGDVRLIVERLHSHGIVHGALHARNIIIDDPGGVHLTHVSPLLHSDFDRDISAVDAIFDSARPLTPALSRRERGQQAINARAVVGAAIAIVIGLLIAISVLWWS